MTFICNSHINLWVLTFYSQSCHCTPFTPKLSLCWSNMLANLVFGHWSPSVPHLTYKHTTVCWEFENDIFLVWSYHLPLLHSRLCFPFLCLSHSRQDNQSCRTSDAQSSTESSYLQAVDSQGVPLCLSCQQPCSTTGGAWDTRFCSHRYCNTNYIQLEEKLRAKLDISNL